MSSRKIDDCVPELQEKYKLFAEGCKLYDIDYIITCTRRTQDEQNALYAQGRTLPGRKVTWTLHSKHIEGKAFDIVIMENGKPDWNADNPKWKLAGQIGKEVGLTWGGVWKSPDFPHYEVA